MRNLSYIPPYTYTKTKRQHSVHNSIRICKSNHTCTSACATDFTSTHSNWYISWSSHLYSLLRCQITVFDIFDSYFCWCGIMQDCSSEFSEILIYSFIYLFMKNTSIDVSCYCKKKENCLIFHRIFLIDTFLLSSLRYYMF